MLDRQWAMAIDWLVVVIALALWAALPAVVPNRLILSSTGTLQGEGGWRKAITDTRHQREDHTTMYMPWKDRTPCGFDCSGFCVLVPGCCAPMYGVQESVPHSLLSVRMIIIQLQPGPGFGPWPCPGENNNNNQKPQNKQKKEARPNSCDPATHHLIASMPVPYCLVVEGTTTIVPLGLIDLIDLCSSLLPSLLVLLCPLDLTLRVGELWGEGGGASC